MFWGQGKVAQAPQRNMGTMRKELKGALNELKYDKVKNLVDDGVDLSNISEHISLIYFVYSATLFDIKGDLNDRKNIGPTTENALNIIKLLHKEGVEHVKTLKAATNDLEEVEEKIEAAKKMMDELKKDEYPSNLDSKLIRHRISDVAKNNKIKGFIEDVIAIFSSSGGRRITRRYKKLRNKRTVRHR